MEVADQAVASARAAPATNEGNKWPEVLSSVGAGAMSAMSLLFAWLAAGTLRRCGAMDDEEEFSCVLWGMSPLICAYVFCWTVTLSPRTKVAGGAVFAGATCLLLLAAAADTLIAPIAGAAAIVLATLYSACACGRALAERRQRAGTERWSAATVASTPTYQSRAEERQELRIMVATVSCMVLIPVIVAASVWFVSWTSPEAEWEAPGDATEVVFFLAGPLVLAVQLMLPCMVGSPVLANICDKHFFAAFVGVIGWLVVVVSASVHFGMVAGAVVFWMGELGMLGFLGYFLAVEAHYKQAAHDHRKGEAA